MDPKQTLTDLEDLAERLGISIRYERLGDGEDQAQSGRFRLKGRQFLLIEKRLQPEARLGVLAGELGRMDLGGIYIKPYLRRLLGQEDGDWDDT